MAIVRYDGRPNGDGTESIQFDVPEGEFAKIIGHTGVGYNLYHNNTSHTYTYTGSSATITVPASAGTFTSEAAGLTRVRIINVNDDNLSFDVEQGAGVAQYTHTAASNVFVLGSSLHALTGNTDYVARIDWVTHDGNFQVTTAAGVYQTTLGINDGDHVEIAEAASGSPINSLTVETGVDYRPGLK